MATTRDIQEIVSKLSSDKAKVREESIKLLNSWLEGERSFGFCKLLVQNTLKLKPNEIPHSETWPFIIKLLIQCVTLEISTSKKRPPKLLFAKTLRIGIQRAEGAKYSGKMLLLLSVVKQLFNHIWDVLRDVPSFQSEYGIILRHLLAVREYRFHMRKRVYCNLVLLYVGKVETSLNSVQSYPKEEVFRYILTLHSLLENPPGDFTDDLREDIVKGFVGIFSHVRDEGKISRKLIECINTYLSKDGPNLGHHSMRIHLAVEEFLFRFWITTHDRSLKDAFIMYARLQIKLIRSAADGRHLIEQLLDVVCKELDQNNIANISLPRSDAARVDKLGALTSSQCGLMELAASVFFWACFKVTKASSSEKRSRRENAATCIKEGLMKGKWLWNSAFCFLIRNYHSRISKDLVIYWFEGICESFHRILNDGNKDHSYNGLLWVLRSLQELSSVLLPVSRVELWQCSFRIYTELGSSWHKIWSCLMHGLPIFSNVTSVVDAALILLGNIILNANDLISTFHVPQDVWDLRLFKHVPSVSALYFIACYFSRKGSQGDIRDALHLRRNLLRAVLSILNGKESYDLNECLVKLLPAAAFALCVGCAPILCTNDGSCSYLDVSEAAEEWLKIEEHEQEPMKQFECSVEFLAEINLGTCAQVSESQFHHGVRLPRQIKEPLVHELDDCFLVDIMDKRMEKMLLSDLFFFCTLLSNCIYCSIITRLGEEKSSLLHKMADYLLSLLDCAISVIQEKYNDIQFHGFLGSGPNLDGTGCILASLRSFISSPLFSIWKDQNFLDDVLLKSITLAIERLLRALAKQFEEYSAFARKFQSEVLLPESSSSINCQVSLDDSKTRIVDMELDVNEDPKDKDILAVSPNDSSGISSFSFSFSMKWKLGMVSGISNFFSILPVVTWTVMFGLMENESDPKICEIILLSLCEHFSSSSFAYLSDLVASMNNMIEMRVALKLSCFNILSAAQCLLGRLVSLGSGGEDKRVYQSVPGKASEQSLIFLGDLVEKVANFDHLDWFGRVKLIDCICNFIILHPDAGQAMIERLLTMLQDNDYRVRIFLARQIYVLFQMWDGHDELFHDICSNFGVRLVLFSKEKLVTAQEVLAAGAQPPLRVETVVITLAHLAFYSEKIELEAVFMMCVIAAMDPCQRELVYTVLDNLSRKLHYTARSKYLEEIMGSILFYWVACNVSLIGLVEVRDLFVSIEEPNFFMQYCCPWVLPALLLSGDNTNLKLVSSIAHQPLAALANDHFVPIFAVCMAMHGSRKSGNEMGLVVLQSSILHIAEISEQERDNLIKKHMVSIVSLLFSLASSASDPAVPFFSKETIVFAIQAVVDGFLEMDYCPRNVCVVDKINVFRPDRVFVFIVEMHYKIEAAVHHRHRCDRLSGVDVLVHVIGHRAAVPSTSLYLFNLIGKYIGFQALQNQCCLILSTLLKAFKCNPNHDVIGVLGEQLQFLVSKLVSCCIPVQNTEPIGSQSSQVVSLLHQLILESDPSLHDYIRELEPFPQIDCFDRIWKFHQDLCKAYSPKDHFLKFVRRASYLSPRLLLWSLQTLHRRLVLGEVIQAENDAAEIHKQINYWHTEPEVISAVWRLVSLCGPIDGKDVRALVSDFISRVGLGDPHFVVFRLPGDSSQVPLFQAINDGSSVNVGFYTNSCISDEILLSLIRMLMKYLSDDSVKIIDETSRTLQGILSTERGQRILLSFDSYDRSLIAVHSKSVNMELVEKLLLSSERKYTAEAISLEDSSIWNTHGKTYEMWICPLVYSLIGYSNDMILRLCQDIVLLKAEVAELLFPNIFANLAGRKDLNIDLCKLISPKVQENIFTDLNDMTKSIQIMLNVLNELRLCHVMEREALSPTPLNRESSKHSRPSSYGSRSRATAEKAKDQSIATSAMGISTLLWEKVYWLSIDYLVVAESAIRCGSYFTSVLYVEHWCEEHFNSLILGNPDFSHLEMLPAHIEILISAVTQINEPDSLYGIIQSHKLTSQIVTYEHEGNWSKALEYYDLQIRSSPGMQMTGVSNNFSLKHSQATHLLPFTNTIDEVRQRKPYKGLMRSLQLIGCTHVLDLYCQGLTSQKGQFQRDSEFTELQYEAAWRSGNWDFSLLDTEANSPPSKKHNKNSHFNENLHSCLRALQEGDYEEFHLKLTESKQDLILSIYHASKESTEFIHSSIVRLQILDHLGMAWDLRWDASPDENIKSYQGKKRISLEPIIPTVAQLEWLNTNWRCILKQTQLHMNLLEPFIAFRRVLLQILGCKDCALEHLLQSASVLRKGSRFSQADAALYEFMFISGGTEKLQTASYICGLGRLEEAKILHAQGQHEMAINLAKYILHNYQLDGEASNVYRLVGKWLAENCSSNSRTILEQYLNRAVELAERNKSTDKKFVARLCQTHFHLAHYTDALFRSYEERLNSNEWQAAMRLRKHKTKELDALIRRLKSSTKGEKTDYSVKIQELQKQLSMDKEEAERLQDDRDNFLSLALEGYKRCLVTGDKYDVRVVFRLISLWFGLSSRQNVINSMLSAVKEVQSYKFIPLVYQIASRMGGSKDGQGPHSFQFALVSLVKKMAIDHPYHTIFQLLALANGDRVKDKQRSRNSFVVDMDKKLAAENLMNELSSHHGTIVKQMKQMVEVYIKLAELETKREDTNKKIQLPRDIRSLRQLDLVPVVTATVPVDRSCQYQKGSFPHFMGLADSIMVMNGINAPKVLECIGSDGRKYRQLAKSGNDDLRQDAVMEQFFGLVNTFLQNHRDTWRRKLGIRTYKVVPFTPSAGVLEWVDGTIPLGEYLLGSLRNGGAHGRYGVGDWSFMRCREYMANAKDKHEAFRKVCENFRPVMHYFFLERFLQPADWFEKRLTYTRSVAASSMVGYIVGLGDRHSMNILIDQATAEVVHIDLGVAFEQGLMLKTPERVPFRLTRDIIDGMGITGVEGVFRRCCEETLSVMRTNKEALLTIVEVFIHDPLYKWALSPLKALQRQKETDDDIESSLEDSQDVYEGNKDAARALLRVKQKLDGYEEGEMRSVHGQVQQLIQDAIDPERLCQMFPGWGAWL
ncbi:PREDICTED: serine/threonine-protein kinase ATM isoform X1 [Nelumbo nucifera]|uniref:Serine/threonine-protein kinase ATM n=1 Tax=Nelumbo nucifera TaxID=4432 RepID=A0A1U7YS51_NELNU|nr:PREDICTED: serine/threonine-protein kinase ATM isoform X1 [Nelumbo nucifera]